MGHERTKIAKGRQRGFTLVEVLVSMAILGVLMLAFTQIFGGSLRASSQINALNELVSEGQVAQQLIASRLQSAYYIYPVGASMQLTGSGSTAKNTVNGANTYTWIVGTQPFIAMILPPTVKKTCSTGSSASESLDACFSFYAYYPVLRSELISRHPTIAPDADPNNANVWVLMEYRANLVDGVPRSSNLLATPPSAPNGTFTTVLTNSASTNPTAKGKSGQMLVDYVQPLGAAPYNTMFSVSTAGKFVDFNLRLQINRAGKPLSAPASVNPLTTRIYPRNWF